MTEQRPSLPPSVLARILSYTVSSTSDVAKLREISRSVGGSAVALLPTSTPASGHWIKCPPKRVDGSFAEGLVEACNDAGEVVYYGDLYEGKEAQWVEVFEGALSVKVRFIGRSWELCDHDSNKSQAKKKMSESELFERMNDICEQIDTVKSAERLQELYEEACELGLMEPIDAGSTFPEDWDEFLPCHPVMLTIQVGPNAKCIKRNPYWELKASDNIETSEAVVALNPGCRFRAVSSSSSLENTVHVLMNLVISPEYKWEILCDKQYSPTDLVFASLWDAHQNLRLVEGVSVVDDAVSNSFRALLQEQIDALARKQVADKAVDYHPNSKDIVRDIVHPALYSYVANKSKLRSLVEQVPPSTFPTIDDDNMDEEDDGSNKDFWGRSYEESKYQWLPTYFAVTKDGHCTIEDYINNLTPREDPVHGAVYHSLSKLFEQALPYMESVYSYVRAVRRELRDDDYEMDYDNGSIEPLDMKYVSLRGQKLQVITKIVDYELKPGQEYEGAWHVEGMSHEEIVLTCLYIFDRDDAIEGGDIEYKRSFLRDEAEYIYMGAPQDRPALLDHMVEQGLVPLGKVETRKGRLIVFPNSHVHKVAKMINTSSADSGNVAKRRIVVFFLVNPCRRIVSTREVAPQQKHSGGNMSHEEALAHRLELMKERKFYKQDWNVREIELCEH